MPEGELVLIDDNAAVRTVVLNRAEQLNAFNQALCSALTDALLVAEADDEVRVVVVTGAGRAFSAGTDLYELAETGDFRGGPGHPLGFERLIDVLASFPKPLLCAVNGIAVGLGATMLGHADMVFMADTARLKCPFTSLSLVPEAASSVTFPLLLGRQEAFWLLASSEWVDAAEAVASGLAWKVVPADDVFAVTQEHARVLAAHPLSALVASKRLVASTFMAAIAEGRRRENAAFDVLLSSPESRAAVSGFAARENRQTEENHA
jgi:enoyl-CoA hydratase/carnithine racemase